MAFFEFLKPKKEGAEQPVSAIKNKLEALTDALEAETKKLNGDRFHFLYNSNNESFQLKPADVTSVDDLLFLSNRLVPSTTGNKERNKLQQQIISRFFHDYPFAKSDLSDEDLLIVLTNWKNCDDDYGFRWSMNRLFGIVCKRIETGGLNETSKNLLLLFQTPEGQYMYNEHRKMNQRIDYMLQAGFGLPVDVHDSWGQSVVAFADNLPEPEKQVWMALFTHCKEGSEGSAPPKAWLKKAEPLIAAVGKEAFAAKLVEWLSLVSGLLQMLHKEGNNYIGERHDFLRDVNHNLFKNLIWCAGLVNNAHVIAALDDYAAWAYKKKPGTGPLSAKTGTACMVVFSMLPFKEAVTRLMKFRNRTTNNTLIKSIDKIISSVAEKAGQDKNLVEEIGVMDFGLDANGSKCVWFGNVCCGVKVDGTNTVNAEWHKEGKPLKSVPAAVKSEHAAAYKALKNELTELSAQLQVQKARLEGYFLRKKSWAFPDWKENYREHPLVGCVARKLIWSFTAGDRAFSGYFEGGQIINADGDVLETALDETTVSLWHPISASVEEVVAWRTFLQQRELVQPFKQAFREVYLLTDAELRTKTYSNRFAAHVLRQHQFAALAKQRSWQYHLMGNWDSHNTPTISIPAYKMTAQFYVNDNGAAEETHNGIFLYITTDQVRFYKEGELQELIDVPPLVFSEVMRDVDLFVGVTSIGNDPAWADNQNGAYSTYWRGYSFGELGESAKLRNSVLQGLVPRLKIRDNCSFDGKFLKVQGSLRNYKIHIGSGNILMEPNDQYLCIVPAGRNPKDLDKVYLPFEGDALLSIIISKALMLADDASITDETIVRQIKG